MTAAGCGLRARRWVRSRRRAPPRRPGTIDLKGQNVHALHGNRAPVGVALPFNGVGAPQQSAVAEDGKRQWRFGFGRAVVQRCPGVENAELLAELVADAGRAAVGPHRRVHEDAVRRWFILDPDAGKRRGRRTGRRGRRVGRRRRRRDRVLVVDRRPADHENGRRRRRERRRALGRSRVRPAEDGRGEQDRTEGQHGEDRQADRQRRRQPAAPRRPGLFQAGADPGSGRRLPARRRGRGRRRASGQARLNLLQTSLDRLGRLGPTCGSFSSSCIIRLDSSRGKEERSSWSG